MAGKHVQLVVRAKDQSSKELDRISASLKALTGNQEDLAKGANKTGGALGALAADVVKLQAASDRLKSLSAIVTQFDKSSAAVARLQSTVRSSASEFAKLARDSDGAAQAASRLSAQLSAEESALSANKAALRESSKELAQVNKLVAQAEANQRRYNETLAKPANVKPSSALRSAGTFVAGDVATAQASQARMTAQVAEYSKAVNQSKATIVGLKTELSAAAKLQADLASQTDKAATALRGERDDLSKARSELTTMGDISAKAGAALGVVSTSQDQVAQAASRMAASLAAAKAKIDALSSVKAPTVAAVASTSGMGIDTNALAEQRRATLEAKSEWVDAQAAVKGLAQQMKAAEQPTVELGQAFGQAQAQARLTKTAYEEQRQTLARLGSGAQSTFASFAAASTAARSAGAATASANTQIASSASAATSGQRSLAQVLRQMASDMGAAAGKTDLYGSSLRRAQGDIRATLALTERLRGEILSLAAGYVSFQAAVGQIGGAINAYRQLEAVQARLGVVLGGDTTKTAAEIAFLQAQADRLGISFGTLADEYGKFDVAAK